MNYTPISCYLRGLSSKVSADFSSVTGVGVLEIALDIETDQIEFNFDLIYNFGDCSAVAAPIVNSGEGNLNLFCLIVFCVRA